MGSSCCKSKEFTLALVNLPDFYYEEQANPLTIESLLTAKAKNHNLRTQCSLQQNQTGEFIYKQEESPNTLFLLKSNMLTGNFQLINRIKETQQHSIWKVLRRDSAEMLSRGDRIKIGLQEFKVFDLKCQEKEDKGFSCQLEHQEQHCRYCFKSCFSEVDPLLSLCKCSGSVKFIHLCCLRTWMNCKAQKSEQNLNLRWFKFEMPKCEICKTAWPRTFTHNLKDYDLYSFTPEPEEIGLPSSQKIPYIVLQSSGIDENGNQVTLFVRISLSQSCLIGSDHSSCRLQLDFQGISPQHAMIFHCNNNIFVSDCGSASGTLIKAKNVQFFSPTKGLMLLYKNMLMNIAIKRSFWDCNNAEPQSFIEITKQDELL